MLFYGWLNKSVGSFLNPTNYANSTPLEQVIYLTTLYYLNKVRDNKKFTTISLHFQSSTPPHTWVHNCNIPLAKKKQG